MGKNKVSRDILLVKNNIITFKPGKYRVLRDILLVGKNLFLRADPIARIDENIDSFVIEWSYNPECDNISEFSKGEMTIGEIKEMRAWVRAVGISHSLRRASECY